MSNNYFNRARTAKNRVEDTNDVIELVDESKHIYYVRTNQHEYLVDLSFTANTVSMTDEVKQYTVDNYDIKLPTSSNLDFNIDTIKYMDKVNSHILPNYKLAWSNLAFNESAENYIPPVSNGVNIESENLDYINIFRDLGINQYRDFDYINMINSTRVDPHKFKWIDGDNPNETVFKQTPITYCNSLTRYGLSWGLPNIEVLSTIIFSENLKTRLKNHFRADDTKNIVVGLYTQYFLQVKIGNDIRVSDIEVMTSLTNVGTDMDCDLLGYENKTFDSGATFVTNSNLINDGAKPTAILGVKNLVSRLGIQIDSTKRQLPMLIIPTAIIR